MVLNLGAWYRHCACLFNKILCFVLFCVSVVSVTRVPDACSHVATAPTEQSLAVVGPVPDMKVPLGSDTVETAVRNVVWTFVEKDRLEDIMHQLTTVTYSSPYVRLCLSVESSIKTTNFGQGST